MLRYKMKEARAERGYCTAEIEGGTLSRPRHPSPMKFDYVFRTRREADQISQPLNPLASVSEHDSPFPFYPPRDITQFYPTAPFSGNSPVKQIKRKRTSTLCPLPSDQTVPFARGNRRKRDKNDHFYFVDYLFQPIENCYRSPHQPPSSPARRDRSAAST